MHYLARDRYGHFVVHIFTKQDPDGWYSKIRTSKTWGGKLPFKSDQDWKGPFPDEANANLESRGIFMFWLYNAGVDIDDPEFTYYFMTREDTIAEYIAHLPW